MTIALVCIFGNRHCCFPDRICLIGLRCMIMHGVYIFNCFGLMHTNELAREYKKRGSKL